MGVGSIFPSVYQSNPGYWRAHGLLSSRVSGFTCICTWTVADVSVGAVVVLIAASWVFRAEGFSLPPNLEDLMLHCRLCKSINSPMKRE